MGRLFDALVSGSQGATPATLAITAIPPSAPPSCANRKTAGIAGVDARAASRAAPPSRPDTRLLKAIREQGFPDAVLARDDSGPDQLQQLNDAELRAYACALGRAAIMDTGRRPGDYTQPAVCQGCGPVWLWPGVPTALTACPWCARRRAGRPIPRPPVRCGDCSHFVPDPINASAGTGSCGVGLPYQAGERGRYPFTARYCSSHCSR